MFDGNLARQGEAKPAAVGATGNQRQEHRVTQVRGHAATIIHHLHAQHRAAQALVQARSEFQARAQGDLPGIGFNGIAQQVEQELMQAVAVGTLGS